MASAAITGRLAYIRASTAAASTATSSQTQVTELTDYTLTFEKGTINVTNHDSSGWHESLAGIGRWNGTANINYLSTGPMQGALRAHVLQAAGNPALVNMTFKQTTSNTAKKYQGKARITGFTVGHPTDNAVLGTLSFEGSGPLVRTA
jgi:predicted secreted protein